MVRHGGVAERLGTGLQNPVRRFESVLTPLLHKTILKNNVIKSSL